MREKAVGDDKENWVPNVALIRGPGTKVLQSGTDNGLGTPLKGLQKGKDNGLVTPLKVIQYSFYNRSLAHSLTYLFINFYSKTVRQYDQSQEEIFLRNALTPVFKVQEDVVTENKYMVNCPLTPNLLSYRSVGHSLPLTQSDKAMNPILYKHPLPHNPIPYNNSSIILDDSFILDASIDNSDDDEDASELNNILELLEEKNIVKVEKIDNTHETVPRNQPLAPLLAKLSTTREVRASKRAMHTVTLYALIVLKAAMIFVICGLYNIISIKKASLAKLDAADSVVRTNYYADQVSSMQLVLIDPSNYVSVPLIVSNIPIIPLILPVAPVPRLLIPTSNDKLTLLIPDTTNAVSQNSNKQVVLKNYQQGYAISTYMSTSSPATIPPALKHDVINEKNLQEIILLVDNTPSEYQIHLLAHQDHVVKEDSRTTGSSQTATTTLYRLQTTIERELDKMSVDKVRALEYVLILSGIIIFTL